MGQALTIASSGLFALGLLAAPLLAGGQELAIGHLETSDDSGGINWLFFHCQQSDPVLRCAIFQTLIMRESGNCTVVNDYSEATFNWNNVTQTWILQEGPTGPCGRISIGTLERDRDTPKYWKYTERKINTKSDGYMTPRMKQTQPSRHLTKSCVLRPRIVPEWLQATVSQECAESTASTELTSTSCPKPLRRCS